eukprot:CAMPEP_0173420098 /NCGR_PEP_ID=MMETSP1357-20121228/1713_1 /TAXON_ID=77926 /ORGANISM="Hemiselmis rufescens, Strain PCC563" /LENGTH=154 /DNA_ID=CAMNT_0014382851 /DNA_START=20 /DNA_END=484 /DNA_ORIENTATION=-
MRTGLLVLACAAGASAFAPSASFVPKSSSMAIAQRPALRAAAPRAAAKPLALQAKFEISEGQEFDLNPVVLVLAMLGWAVPGLLPSDIPLYGGKGLTTALFAEIGEHLQTFPAPPGMSDPFWVVLFLWHSGLFATMIFATIGYNGYGKNASTKY